MTSDRLILPGHTVLDTLHHGRTRVVYRGRRNDRPTTVIVKTDTHASWPRDLLASLDREATILRGLVVPGGPRVVAVEKRGSIPALILEDLGGETLAGGAGLYVDGEVGAAGSTGRGEANLFNLSSFLIVENMRRGMHPKDAGMAALQRIKDNTVEERLLNGRGFPAFDVRFFILNKSGDYAGVAMYGSRESNYAICTENGAESPPLEGLLEGSPTD